MTSRGKAGWRRTSAKTHGMFESIPSLRVLGKDPHAPTSAPRKPPSPRKQPQYADPTLFPGRRLDRRQPSTMSVVSGNSGLSGAEQGILQGSAMVRGSTEESTRPSHASMPKVGVNLNPLPDSSNPWGSVRPHCDENTVAATTPLRPSEDEARSVSARAAGAPPHSFSKALPQQSSFAKVSRWQHANFKHTVGTVTPQEAGETLLESPHSVLSDDSQLQPLLKGGVVRERELRLQDHNKDEEEEEEGGGEKDDNKTEPWFYGLPVPTPPPLAGPGHPREGGRHLHPHRRPANTPAVSPTGLGPRLNKILWALAPDEHANMSDASHLQSTCRDPEDRRPARPLHRTVTVTDLEAASDISCHVPETPRTPHLTEALLIDHNHAYKVSTDDRIYQWLAECDKETISQSLPTHLPDIQYTFKFLKSAT